MASVGAPLPRLPQEQVPARPRVRTVLGVLGAAAGLVLMVVQVPFFVSIALTAPLGARVGLGVLWLVQFTLGVHWRSRPGVVVLVALLMMATWYVLGVHAAPFFGWQVG